MEGSMYLVRDEWGHKAFDHPLGSLTGLIDLRAEESAPPGRRVWVTRAAYRRTSGYFSWTLQQEQWRAKHPRCRKRVFFVFRTERRSAACLGC